MPTYEYQCTACGHQLEEFQKMSDEPLKDCPVCHQPTLNKLVSAAGFQLKGSGWYVTDYSAKGKSKSADKADTATGSSDTGSKETKSGDTAATTTETKSTTTKTDTSSSSTKSGTGST